MSFDNKDYLVSLGTASDIVCVLNYDMMILTGDDEINPLSLVTDGGAIFVVFLGEVIWSDENDLREYIEGSEVYEPLVGYLRREITSICAKYSKVKLLGKEKPVDE